MVEDSKWLRFLPRLVLLGLGAWAVTACGSSGPAVQPPEVVQDFDVARYLGTWYEIAAIPIRPQRGCVGTTATYGMEDDGDVSVDNRCYRDSFAGDPRGATARAFIPDPETPAKLKVQFFWPFRAEYWVVHVDADYTVAVVSNSRRSTLWVLHRQPCMEQAAFDTLWADLEARAFELGEVEATLQRDAAGQECRATLPR
jgi:apolipoprotein D and lipocalin family protein